MSEEKFVTMEQFRAEIQRLESKVDSKTETLEEKMGAGFAVLTGQLDVLTGQFNSIMAFLKSSQAPAEDTSAASHIALLGGAIIPFIGEEDKEHATSASEEYSFGGGLRLEFNGDPDVFAQESQEAVTSPDSLLVKDDRSEEVDCKNTREESTEARQSGMPPSDDQNLVVTETARSSIKLIEVTRERLASEPSLEREAEKGYLRYSGATRSKDLIPRRLFYWHSKYSKLRQGDFDHHSTYRASQPGGGSKVAAGTRWAYITLHSLGCLFKFWDPGGYNLSLCHHGRRRRSCLLQAGRSRAELYFEGAVVHKLWDPGGVQVVLYLYSICRRSIILYRRAAAGKRKMESQRCAD